MEDVYIKNNIYEIASAVSISACIIMRNSIMPLSFSLMIACLDMPLLCE